MNNTLKKILQWLVTIAILFFSVWFTFKGIEVDKLINILTNIDYLYALLPVPIVLASHYMRAWRWKTFLKPIKEISSTWSLFSAVMILYAVNTVIPRGGEFLRPYIVAKKEKISYSSTFATIILERVIDVVTLLILFGLTFALLSERIVQILPQDINPNIFIVVLVLIIMIALLNLYPPFIDFMLKATVKPFSQSAYEKLLGIVERFKKGLAVVKQPSQYFRISLESGIIWLLYALPLYITFFAFPFQEELQLGLVDATMLVIVAGIAVTVAPVPGAIGVYHYFVSTAMAQLYGLDREIGLAYATVVHAVSIITQTLVGAIFFFKEGITTINPKTDDIEEK